jgi:hypothetical protein
MSICLLLSSVALFCMDKLPEYQGKILSEDFKKSLIVFHIIKEIELPKEIKEKIKRDYHNFYPISDARWSGRWI